MSSKLKKCNFLIIEDNPEQVEFITRAISTSFDAKIELCPTGEKAIEIMKKDFIPDIVIVDPTSKQTHGQNFLIELLKLNGRFKNTKVLGMADSIDIETQMQMIKLGVEIFVRKSIAKSRLTSTIEYIANKRFNCTYTQEKISGDKYAGVRDF